MAKLSLPEDTRTTPSLAEKVAAPSVENQISSTPSSTKSKRISLKVRKDTLFRFTTTEPLNLTRSISPLALHLLNNSNATCDEYMFAACVDDFGFKKAAHLAEGWEVPKARVRLAPKGGCFHSERLAGYTLTGE